MEKTILFLAEKETKGAVRYTEITDGGATIPMAEAVIGKVYVRKNAFPDGMPTRFTMVITPFAK